MGLFLGGAGFFFGANYVRFEFRGGRQRPRTEFAEEDCARVNFWQRHWEPLLRLGACSLNCGAGGLCLHPE